MNTLSSASLSFVLAFIGGIAGSLITLHFMDKRKPVSPPEPVAQILPRKLPSHVRESRILVNDTRVDFLNDREYTPAYIAGYHREPGRGNYYLVVFNVGTLAETRRWVPDTYVWEKGELRRIA